MPVFRGSRYEGLDSIVVTTSDGKNKRFLVNKKAATIDGSNDFYIRKKLEHEELDAIAAEVFNDSRTYWILAEVNEIQFPLDIERGRDLIIPNISILSKTF